MKRITGCGKMNVDVVLLTKNSLKPCLKDCLESIYRNVPVNRLIVVDGGSTDGTLKLIQQYPKVEVIDDSGGNRATARQKGIEAVETEWFMFVDSDVILCEGWFDKAAKLINDNVGAIWGVAVPIEPHYYNMIKAMSKLYRYPIKKYLVKQIRNQRCPTHDTLFRTKLLKDIKIPKDLHVLEDDYIGKWIIKKGYRFLKTESPYCLHNLGERNRIENAILYGYLKHKYKAWNFKASLLRFILAFPKAFWILSCTGDFIAAKRQILNYCMAFKGWLAYG